MHQNIIKSEPPAVVIKGLDEWLYSVKDKVGSDLIKEIILEEGHEGTHASEGRLTVGEGIFKKGSKFYLSILNHEFEHLLDTYIITSHLKAMLSCVSPDELKDVLTNCRSVLLHQHYEEVLDATADLLKNDHKFKSLLMEIERRTKDLELSKAIKTFLSRDIDKHSLSSLGYVLSSKKEKPAIDEHLKKNYGIPSLSSFASKSYNLRHIDDRLVELNGSPRLTMFPELSSTFAELSPDEKAELYHFGSQIAKDNTEILLQIAYDAGKIEQTEITEITNKAPTRGEIYTGPVLIPQDI